MPPRLRVRRALVQFGALIVEKEPKTERSRRTIVIDEVAAAALRHHRKAQLQEQLAAAGAYAEGDRVFADEIGRALSPGSVSAGFARLVKASGLPRITLHGLRHSFATVGLEAGVDTVYVSEILGHSSASITSNIYQHVRDERRAEAVQQIADAIDGGAR